MRCSTTTLCLTLALGLLSSATAANISPTRPNILVFVVDDMGVMDTSVPFLTDGDGQPVTHPLNRLYRTPSMERLARDGIRFETFYANSVCSPSRVSIMTGQSAARHHTTQWIRPTSNNHGPLGPRDWRWLGLSEIERPLPAILKQAGYHTIHAGKSHLGPEGSVAEKPTRIGFDVNIGGGAMGRPGSYYARDHFGGKKGKTTHSVPGLETYHGENIYLTEALTLEMQAAISDAVESGTPFFAHMAYYAVHSPFQPNREYLEHYKDADIPGRAKAFATMIEGMDASVGRILDHLETIDVAEDTLVLFLSDNGSDAPLGQVHQVASSAPLRGKKGTHYEGGMRIPFIAAWAKPSADHPLQERLPIAAGTLSLEMADITDLMPTLLAVAGVETDLEFDGDNITAALTGDSLERESEWLMHFPHAHRSSYWTSLRHGDWKVIHHYHPGGKNQAGRYQLFNLADDPFEQTNLAAEEPEQLHRMMQRMSDQLESHNAQYPIDQQGNPLPPRLP